MDLKDKVAFITGAAEGIGRALAEALLEKGCQVFFGDINDVKGAATAEELGKRFGQENVGFEVMDVTDFDRFTDVFSQAVSKFGRVNIMVNNAGLINESQWSRVTQVNVIGVMNGTQLAMEHMRKDKGGEGGRVINISSSAGLELAQFLPCYCATKFAARAYTQCLAAHMQTPAKGIQFAALCPEGTETPLVRSLDDEKFPGLSIVKGQFLQGMMAPSKIGEALLELLQLENMNGSVLKVSVSGTTFHNDLNMPVPQQAAK